MPAGPGMPELNESGEVRAAGGVVVRAGDRGEGVEVLVVHRPRYDDWSLPKGKAAPGEDDLATALREVHEETGLRCRPLEPLPEVRYHDHLGRPKVVRYWTMQRLDGSFAPHDEVDEVRWVDLTEATRLLTFPQDVELVRLAGSTAALGDSPPRAPDSR